MIRWANQLLIGDNVKVKKDKVVASINNREAIYGIYCITYASHPKNLFDILDANELLFPHYKNADIFIVGLAKGKDEAIFMVQNMLLEVYNNTGGFDVRAYFT